MSWVSSPTERGRREEENGTSSGVNGYPEKENWEPVPEKPLLANTVKDTSNGQIDGSGASYGRRRRILKPQFKSESRAVR